MFNSETPFVKEKFNLLKELFNCLRKLPIIPNVELFYRLLTLDFHSDNLKTQNLNKTMLEEYFSQPAAKISLENFRLVKNMSIEWKKYSDKTGEALQLDELLILLRQVKFFKNF